MTSSQFLFGEPPNEKKTLKEVRIIFVVLFNFMIGALFLCIRYSLLMFRDLLVCVTKICDVMWNNGLFCDGCPAYDCNPVGRPVSKKLWNN